MIFSENRSTFFGIMLVRNLASIDLQRGDRQDHGMRGVQWAG
jgi:hypothetical protein